MIIYTKRKPHINVIIKLKIVLFVLNVIDKAIKDLGFKTSTGEVMLVYVDQGDGYPDKIWVVEQIANIKTISGVNWS